MLIGDLPATGVRVRGATAADAAACAAIYAPYVTDTAITFETAAPTPAEMAERIRSATSSHAWLVGEPVGAPADRESGGEVGRVIGYAYAGPFASREAYRWSCEVTVYIERGRRRTGAGRALYGALLTRLVERGYRTAVAKVTLPNEASLGLHQAFGFEPVGVHRRIGFKLGTWHDVAISQLALARGDGVDDGPPAEPR